MIARLANIISESFVDGDGVRFSIFMQGCPHNCKGCHNPTTHNFNGGSIIDTEQIIKKFKSNPIISGITLTGGEPLCQIEAATEFAVAAQNSNLSVWCYTGYTYDYLVNENFNGNIFFTREQIANFFNYIDVLVDGPFIESQRDLTMQFCGSKNQRLIDLPKTRAQKKIIAWSLK